MKRERPHLWVVEVLWPDGWTPTNGACFTLKAARKELRWWRTERTERYRIVKYVREGTR